MDQYCTFRLADQLYGIPVHRVQEVIRGQSMTRVPLARNTVRGLINLRGQIVTAIDLRRRIGLPEQATTDMTMNVVVNCGDEVYSLMVDEIGEVLTQEHSTYDKPPANLKSAAADLIYGVYKLHDRLLLLLDLDQILDSQARP